MADQHSNERVRSVVGPPLLEHGYEVVDVERQGAVLRVTVDLVEGRIDMDGVTAATRLVSDLLDSHDLMGERTSLEVSSPGVERTLRTPEHFRRFVGTEVALKTRPGTEGDRRVTGILESADEEAVVVGGRRLSLGDIERARTVFVWPPKSQKAKPKNGGSKRIGRAS